jgi:hypothetical protein
MSNAACAWNSSLSTVEVTNAWVWFAILTVLRVRKHRDSVASECNKENDVRELVYTAYNIHVISCCLYINLELRERTNISHTGGKNCLDNGLFNEFAYQAGRNVTFYGTPCRWARGAQKEPPTNFRRQLGGMKQDPYWYPQILGTTVSNLVDQAPWDLCALVTGRSWPTDITYVTETSTTTFVNMQHGVL